VHACLKKDRYIFETNSLLSSCFVINNVIWFREEFMAHGKGSKVIKQLVEKLERSER
jgi:hypothetical protein